MEFFQFIVCADKVYAVIGVDGQAQPSPSDESAKNGDEGFTRKISNELNVHRLNC